MKKVFSLLSLIILLTVFLSCTSVPKNDSESKKDFNYYLATSDKDCNLTFEFINQSTKPLNIVAFIAETTNLNKKFIPELTSEDYTVPAQDSLTFEFNANKILDDFDNTYSVGIQCYEKEWSWYQYVKYTMKYKRVRILVTNADKEGAQMLYPTFYYKDNFTVKETSTEYDNIVYKEYLLNEMPEDYKNLYETRILFRTRYNQLASIYSCSCKDKIEELLNNRDFTIIMLEERRYILLNTDPLDVNNYIADEDYDFIYEIANQSSEDIVLANIIMDENSIVLSYTDDVELKPGKTYQFKYQLNQLEKIYGSNSRIALDFKKINEKKWNRDWENNFNHKNQKHVIVITDGTSGNSLYSFDIWNALQQQTVETKH